MFRAHRLRVYVNGTWFHDVLIDSHVFERHGKSMTDRLVLKLVFELHMGDFSPVDVDENGFQYFVNGELNLEGKSYRLVWLIPPDGSYLGVRTAFRRRSHGK